MTYKIDKYTLSVKHYAHRWGVKPLVKDGVKCYPVHVRVAYRRKTYSFTSLDTNEYYPQNADLEKQFLSEKAKVYEFVKAKKYFDLAEYKKATLDVSQIKFLKAISRIDKRDLAVVFEHILSLSGNAASKIRV